MKRALNIFLYFWGCLTLVLYFSGCESKNRSGEPSNYELLMANDSILQTIKNIVKASYENDAVAFAKEVSYPLLRPYPLKDIQNEEEMRAYFPIMVDDSLRNVIINSSAEDWSLYGWRGYSLYNGSYIWIDGKIYAVNYLSNREKQMLDSLTSMELKTLPPKLSSGWIPVLTLHDEENGTVYRIDKNLNDIYRLAIYEKTEALNVMPSHIYSGKINIEGSANIISYVFADDYGNEFTIFPDAPVSGSPELILPDGSGIDLEKAYWYELFNR